MRTMMALAMAVTIQSSKATLATSGGARGPRGACGAWHLAAQGARLDALLPQQVRDDVARLRHGLRHGGAAFLLEAHVEGHLGARQALHDVVVDLQGAALAGAEV